MKHIFLTGAKHIGKSTIVRRLLEAEKGTIGGFFTRRTETLSPGNYAVHLLQVQPDGSCAEPSEDNILFFCGKVPEPGEREERKRRFEQLGTGALRQAVQSGTDLIVMDELGPGESESLAFQASVFEILDGDIPVLGVLQRSEAEFLQKVAAHPEVQIIEVTKENRERLAAEILNARSRM